MIGMMNAGTDNVEFYTTRFPTSLYRPQKKQSLTYMEDGRVLQDGQMDDALELWKDLIIRIIIYRYMRDLRKSQSGIIPALRRFSQRFHLTRSKRSTTRQELYNDKEEVISRPVQLEVFNCEPSRIPDRPIISSPITQFVPSPTRIVTHV